MKKIQSFITILGVVLKWAGVAMVLIRTVQYFNTELQKELGNMENEALEPLKDEKDGD